MATQSRAFTLIELLVVITIIVVLLAMLSPALDKAIYQAELAVCGAGKNAIAKGAIVYAAGNSRAYPFRPGVRDDTVWSPSWLYNGNPALLAWGAAFGDGTTNTQVYDDRPTLRSFLGINAALNDPLTQKVDFESVDVDTSAFATCNLFFGFGYKGFRPMARLGDRMTYGYDGNGDGAPDPQYTWRFSVLASDRDCISASGVQISHPDARGLTVDTIRQNQDYFAQGMKQTFSFWKSDQGVGRGPVDLNFAMQDGSVLRMTQVEIWKSDTAFVPDVTQGKTQLGNWWNTMPIQK